VVQVRGLEPTSVRGLELAPLPSKDDLEVR